jgi:diphosphomevalonate decarboxylase
MHRVRALRQDNIPVFFTIDAGPQVKAICLPEYQEQVKAAMSEISGVQDILTSGLGEGASTCQS